MKSAWKVTSNIINGQRMYGVYRKLDVDETDHSGNREHFGGYMLEREWAEDLAKKLNGDQKESPREGDSEKT